MTETEQMIRVALVQAASARLNARVAGMEAENRFRLECGNQIAYGDEAFEKAIEDEGLTADDVAKILRTE